MAVNHVSFNDQTHHGRMLRRILNNLEQGFDELNDFIEFFAQARDGNGSLASHFTYLTSLLETGSDAETKMLHDELQSLAGKLNTTGEGVTVTHVKDAILQVFAKLR
jgi:uncharacterized phage infection (PIP) family protein YhgE